MFSFENHVKIAADSVQQLRKPDVFRLLDNLHLTEFLTPFAEWLVIQRPDLTTEVEECLHDLLETDAPTI